jgi:Ca2+-binding EF-hand superfamily protein
MNLRTILPRFLVVAALLAAGAAQAETKGPFAALDANQDGALSAQEFQAGYPGLVRAIEIELRLRDQFRALDADRSGAIESGEYARMTLVQRAGTTAPALARFDANHDQKLDFAEYLTAVRALAAPAASRK